jgi:sterol desaturase/sphingolipid hydroxylase (fatty acid hydroxylase superfamily)
MHVNTIFYHATPALIVLIGIEAVYVVKEKRDGIKDIFLSLAFVLGRLPVSALINGLIVYIYTLTYHFRFFTLPANCWWAWVICFFSDDFSFYWFHRLSHQVRFLWASHSVHHSSEKYTFISGLRVPWTSELTGNFLFWAWMPLTGIEPFMIVWMKSLAVLYQFWMHTETIKRLPKWFEAFFNTPSHHRVHHGSDVAYLDKNHGGTLIIWDKIFGTFQQEIFKPTYGLTDNIKSYNPFVIAFHEWRKIIKDVKKSRSMADTFHYFFNTPGWSPDGSTKTTKQLQADLKKRQSTI